jgi:hypothetical protein
MEARVAGENVRVVAEITGSDDDMVVVVTVF